MEHLQHFGLTRDPFSNEPDLRFYFESGSHHDTQRRVERGIRQHKGLTVLTGEGGMGKTLLSRRILEALEEEVFESTLLTMLPGTADATSILQRFARQIGADEPASDRAALFAQIYEQLAIVREDGRHAVLIIDDAQIMAPTVLAELGGLLSLEYEDKRLLSMLLVGSDELDKLIENDAGMKPRVDVRVRLQPFDLVNAEAYVKHRLMSVSGPASLVSDEAIETLHKLGRGRPRLINTLADNALFETYLGGRLAMESMDVERAAVDLGIGPDPGTTFSPQHRAVPPPPSLLIPSAPPSSVTENAAPAPAFDIQELLPETPPSEVTAEVPASDTVAASLASVVMQTPAISFDDDEFIKPIVAAESAVAEFDLTSEVPVKAAEVEEEEDRQDESSISPTLDLEEGLEAALADFNVPEDAGAPSLSLVPPTPEAFSESPAAPELNLEESLHAPQPPTRTAEAVALDQSPEIEHPLPPIAEGAPALEIVPEAASDEPEVEAEADILAALPPAVDLMAEAEALEPGIAPAPEPEPVLEGLEFDLEPVTTTPETKIAFDKELVLEMDLEDPIEGEDLSLETDLGVVEAAELTPLELESAEEFDDGLFVELLEE